MTNKELELRNKIKEHAVRLKEYHNSEKKKRSEAQLNLDQVPQTALLKWGSGDWWVLK